MIRRSYDQPQTKTSIRRDLPVHPALAAILAEWKSLGWAAMMGASPSADDLLIPMTDGRRTPHGKMRSKNDSYKRLQRDRA